MPSLRLRLLALATFVPLILSACGSSSPAPAAPAPAPATPAAAAPVAAAPAAPAPLAAPKTPQEAYDRVMAMPAAERSKAILDGARAEGAVVFHNVLNTEVSDAVADLFAKKYPFVKLQNNKLSTPAMLDRVLTEHRAGRQVADVIEGPAAEHYVIKKTGILGKYRSPERDGYDKLFKDEEGYQTSFTVDPEVVGFSTKHVQKAEAPRNLSDLLDPKWKGKMGRTVQGARWLAALNKHMGKDKAAAFLQELVKQDVRIYPSHSALNTAIIQGEVVVGFDLHMSNPLAAMKKGAPIDFVMSEPAFFYNSEVGLAANAPHPFAAMLLVDFLLSKEAHQVNVDMLRRAARPDMPYVGAELIGPALKTGIVYRGELVGEGFNEYEKQFQNLFIRK